MSAVDEPAAPAVPRHDGIERVDSGLQTEQRRRVPGQPWPEGSRELRAADDPLFFLAHKQAEGAYSVTLTEEGLETFETALGIARDLGGKTRISPQSTIADIMERTATREELSRVLRTGQGDLAHRLRVFVLRRKLRGSEKPSQYQRVVGHIGKIVIVAVVAFCALWQFVLAVQDIEAIPGILANIPSDILHFQPTAAFGQVGNRISDAGQRVLAGILVACLAYLLAKVIRPFARIYRLDQVLPGERVTLRLLNGALRRIDRR